MVANTRKVSTKSDIKKIDDAKDLPSGLIFRLRRTSIQTLMAAGMIPNSLMTLVQKALEVGSFSMSPAEFSGDPQKMTDMLKFMDIVICHCVAEPEINMLPSDNKQRDAELVYVDELDDEDKAFIFQYATGGTDDVAQFRIDAKQQLDAAQSSAPISRATKRAASRK